MVKKVMLWKTKGMNRDLSVSSFSPEFAYENLNLRLSTNDGNTLMSWVNEKGTKKYTITIAIKTNTPIVIAIIPPVVLLAFLTVFLTTLETLGVLLEDFLDEDFFVAIYLSTLYMN